MNYRADIDGLRAIAVILVILFHCNITLFSGGYVGVDVFFVISGYLITSLLIEGIRNKTFTFRGFYKRRAARLLPALSITLIAVLAFGFVFYPTAAYDNLGKQVFFSSFGAANILFAQGTNYFVQESHYQPLIHLWSLGVEEQFYVVWPLLLLALCRFSNKTLLKAVTLLGITSLYLSERALSTPNSASYFLPHFRAFELLIGAACSVILINNPATFNNLAKQNTAAKILPPIALLAIFLPSIFFTKATSFPGINALAPCLGTAVLILVKPTGFISRLLQHKLAVLLGLISYPLYLYHQPVISFTQLLSPEVSNATLLALTFLIAAPLSWATYYFLEKPIRRVAHQKKKSGKIVIGALILSIPAFSGVGLAIAKLGGIPERFAILNPFALEVAKNQSATFHQHYKRGFEVDQGKVLFIGDSLLQQYVYPIQKALGIEKSDIDLVTRGGCVLLKGVEFEDKFADISCNDLREKLYKLNTKYETVFISQAWESYDTSVLNFPDQQNKIERWQQFIERTVQHFESQGSKVVLIGPHLALSGTQHLQATISLTQTDYLENLENLTASNESRLRVQSLAFDKIAPDSVKSILPSSIFCSQKECVTNDGKWSYFSDGQHLSAASTDFVTEKLMTLYPNG